MKNEEKIPVIEVKNMVAGYGNTVILDDISFNVMPGEVFIILGGSGCGKSTLLKHMIGLLPPKRGSVKIGGRDIVCANDDVRREIMRSFGVLYQSGALFSSMTVGENVALPLEEFTTLTAIERKEKVAECLELVGLPGTEKLMPSELSGGMKKRAGLARALALQPPLLFFDEPSAGLDPISSAQLDQLILTLRDKLKSTMVMVTHELDSIYTVGDRAIMLDKATHKIIAEGNPRVLRDTTTDPVVKAFLTRSGTLNHNT